VEIISGPHILAISPYILSEIVRVLAYPRLQARWELNEKTIMEFVGRVGDVAEIVLTTTPDRVVSAGPDDDPIVQTAVLVVQIFSVLATRTCSKRRLSSIAPAAGSRSRTTLISTTFSLADQSVDALSNNHHVGTFAGGFEARRWECETVCRGAASWKRVQHRLVIGVVRCASR